MKQQFHPCLVSFDKGVKLSYAAIPKINNLKFSMNVYIPDTENDSVYPWTCQLYDKWSETKLYHHRVFMKQMIQLLKLSRRDDDNSFVLMFFDINDERCVTPIPVPDEVLAAFGKKLKNQVDLDEYKPIDSK